MLTIYGNQFVDKEGYNIVKLGHTIGSEINQYCYVEEVWNEATVVDPDLGITYNSKIECRVSTDYNRLPH